jgi:hypothetical protein
VVDGATQFHALLLVESLSSFVNQADYCVSRLPSAMLLLPGLFEFAVNE